MSSHRRGAAVVSMTAALGLAWSVGPAVAGPMVDRGAYEDAFSFAGHACGRDWDVTIHIKGRYWVHSDHDGVPIDAYHEVFSYTGIRVGDNGDTWQNNGKVNKTGDVVVEHVEGNIYRITTREVGNSWGLYSASGRAVWRDRGVFTWSDLIDTKGDDDPTNDEIVKDFFDLSWHGPHIFFESTEPGSPFCEYVDEAIALG